jgi:hypothetical protein
MDVHECSNHTRGQFCHACHYTDLQVKAEDTVRVHILHKLSIVNTKLCGLILKFEKNKIVFLNLNYLFKQKV